MSDVFNCVFTSNAVVVVFYVIIMSLIGSLQLMKFDSCCMFLIVSLQLMQFDFMLYVLHCVCTVNAI